MGIQFTGMASGLDTSSMITELMKAEYTKVEREEKELTKVEWKNEIWSELNTEIFSFYKDELFDFKSSGTYAQSTLTSSDETAVSVVNAESDISGSFSINVTAVAKGAFMTGSELTDVDGTTTAAELFGMADTDLKTITVDVAGGDSVEVTIIPGDTMDSIANKFEALDVGLKMDYDDTFNRFFVSSEDTGLETSISFGGDDAVLTAMGFESANRTAAGSNAVFEYNGTILESASNEFTVNGLSLTLNGTGESTVSVNRDTDAVYEQVKTFITAYNELLGKMNKLDGAESATDFEPLTDDEKEAMTDDEIEDWETTIKDSLLRNDDNLGSIVSTMRYTMSLSSGVDTSEFTYTHLSQLGIMSGSYDEMGELHIYGDSDDSTYSSKDNTLRTAIEDDPDAVKELLTALGESMYESFQGLMSSTSMSSAFTFYNDKHMDGQVEEYEEEIDDLEDYMDKLEDKYYKQFTAMELAIQESNNVGSWLSQQLAGL